MKNKSWFSMVGMANHAEIMIYDEIGVWGISAKDFVDELNALDVEKIDLRLNTPGGSVFDGIAIYNALKRHKASITVYIDGLAASMGSIIALAGETVHMAENAFYMIHNPWGFAIGDASEMRGQADVLDKLAGTMARIYSEFSGMDYDTVIAAMDAETWYGAEDALEAGFITEIDEGHKIAAYSDLDRFKFKHTPEIKSPGPDLTEVDGAENREFLARKYAERRVQLHER